MSLITCWTCHEEKQSSEFNWKNKSLGQRKGYCRECDKVIKHNFYNRHKKRLIVESAYRRNEIRKRFQVWKKTLACKRCGESDSCCLDFHHLNPKHKDDVVSAMVGQGVGWIRIMKEVRRCIVVCRNCHAKIHQHRIKAADIVFNG